MLAANRIQAQEKKVAIEENLASYITPKHPITFKLNFHFYRPNTSNPKYNTYDDLYKRATAADCDTLVKILNKKMAQLHPPDLPVSPPVRVYTNSYVRYVLAADEAIDSLGKKIKIPHVYFHNSDEAFTEGSLFSRYLYEHDAVNPESEINLFFMADLSYKGVGMGNYGFVMISCIEWQPTLWTNNAQHILDANLILHELTHTAGLLHHTDLDDMCARINIPPDGFYPKNVRIDYTIETHCPGCWGNVPSKSQGGVASNNIMGYNNDRTYLSPNQIGSFFYSVYSGINAKFTTTPKYFLQKKIKQKKETPKNPALANPPSTPITLPKPVQLKMERQIVLPKE